MNWGPLQEKIASLGVIPVVAIDDPEAALPLADALLEGGLPIAEITFRTAAGAAVIEKLAKQRPELLLGAGTILTIEHLKKAHDTGATFGVAAGLNVKVVEEAIKLGFPFAPGIMTPSEVETALDMGLSILKFFPAETAGGIKMLKALAGPYVHTGVRFLPTGGVNAENFRDYLDLSVVAAVGGSWVAKRQDIADGNWTQIKCHCKRIAELMAARA